MAAYNTLCPGCFVEKGKTAVCPHCGYNENEQRSPLVLPHMTMLDGRYLAGRVLGKPGGFGITYLAWDLSLETCVAIKEYLPRDMAGRDTDRATVAPHSREDEKLFRYGLEQFLQEARVLAKFDHANVVRVRAFFEENDTAYLVMDYYKGITLEEYRKQKGGKIPVKLAMDIMMPVLDGLREVHAKGFLHRDIKPQNIYLTKDGRPILLDFGAARFVMGERSRSLSVVLTSGFAPYEQYHKRGKQGPWTDIYSCGATLYNMVTGKAPPEAIERKEKDELAPPAGIIPNISKAFNSAIIKSLAIESGDRPQRVRDFQDMLMAETSEAPQKTSSITKEKQKSLSITETESKKEIKQFDGSTSIAFAIKQQPVPQPISDPAKTNFDPEQTAIVIKQKIRWIVSWGTRMTVNLFELINILLLKPAIKLFQKIWQPDVVWTNIRAKYRSALSKLLSFLNKFKLLILLYYYRMLLKINIEFQIKLWALLTVVLYILCLFVLVAPLFLFVSEGDEVFEIFNCFVPVLILVHIVLLLIPVAVVRERPIKRRKIVVSAIIGAIPMGVMAMGFFGSIILIIWGESATNKYLYHWSALFIPAAFWLVWGIIFYKNFASKEASSFTSTITRWLLRGSILELLVAIPSHIISRHRNECCAPAFTLLGIAMGISIALMSFGPGVFFLFAKRIKAKKGKQYNNAIKNNSQ